MAVAHPVDKIVPPQAQLLTMQRDPLQATQDQVDKIVPPQAQLLTMQRDPLQPR